MFACFGLACSRCSLVLRCAAASFFHLFKLVTLLAFVAPAKGNFAVGTGGPRWSLSSCGFNRALRPVLSASKRVLLAGRRR